MKILLFLSLALACLGSTTGILLQGSCSKVASQNNSIIKPITNGRETSPNQNIRKWIAPEVLGLKLGKSTLGDVKRRFGVPVWEGENQEKVYIKDSEDEILVQYRNLAGIDAQFGSVLLDFIIGNKTKIVKALAIYPGERLTREYILKRYGDDYFEIESWESDCIEKDRKPGPSGKKMNYPIALVYPNKGMYVSFYEDNYVIHIGYGMRCTEKE